MPGVKGLITFLGTSSLGSADLVKMNLDVVVVVKKTVVDDGCGILIGFAFPVNE